MYNPSIDANRENEQHQIQPILNPSPALPRQEKAPDNDSAVGGDSDIDIDVVDDINLPGPSRRTIRVEPITVVAPVITGIGTVESYSTFELVFFIISNFPESAQGVPLNSRIIMSSTRFGLYSAN